MSKWVQRLRGRQKRQQHHLATVIYVGGANVGVSRPTLSQCLSIKITRSASFMYYDGFSSSKVMKRLVGVLILLARDVRIESDSQLTGIIGGEKNEDRGRTTNNSLLGSRTKGRLFLSWLLNLKEQLCRMLKICMASNLNNFIVEGVLIISCQVFTSTLPANSLKKLCFSVFHLTFLFKKYYLTNSNKSKIMFCIFI